MIVKQGLFASLWRTLRGRPDEKDAEPDWLASMRRDYDSGRVSEEVWQHSLRVAEYQKKKRKLPEKL